MVSEFIPPQSIDDQWDIEGLEKALAMDFGAELPVRQWLDADDSLHEEGVRERLAMAVLDAYKTKRTQIGEEVANQLEKQLMLQILDRHWKEHLASMDYLRQGIHLRGYAQKNPEQEYKREAFQLFEQLLGAVKLELVQTLARIQVQSQEEVAAMENQRLAEAEAISLQFQHADVDAVIAEQQQELAAIANGDEPLAAPGPFVRDGTKIGRNDVCPCGSGKKYKHCHGQLS